MRAAATLLAVVLVAGCAAQDEATQDGATMEETTTADPTLADFAGTWEVTSTLEGTPDPVPSTMTGTEDASTWTMSLEGRPNIPLRVSMEGDSLIAHTEEYESILRPGVMVTVRTASVLEGDALSGTLVATYNTPTGEEVVRGTTTGTRVMR